MFKTRESQLEGKIKVLEETRSDLEAEVDKLEKRMKQLEILPSDIEQLIKVQIHIACSSCMRARVRVCSTSLCRRCMWHRTYLLQKGSQ